MPASVNTPLLVVAAPAKLSEKSQTRLHTHARATGKNTEIGNRHGGGRVEGGSESEFIHMAEKQQA